MDDAVPQSLFVVVSWESTAPCCISLLQLETKIHNQDEYDPAADLTKKQRPRIRPRRLSFSSFATQLDQKEYVAHFNQPLAHGFSTPTWMFSPLKTSTSTSSAEELYMLPFRSPKYHETDVPLRGCAFNIGTQTCRSIPSNGYEIGCVVTLGGYIYAISRPITSNSSECFDLPFLRYGPDTGFWEHLNPFPSHAVPYKLGTYAAHVVATAVWDNAILFNMGGRKIWAYEVEGDKWYPVKVEDDWWCCSILGEAVVLENTIYALTKHSFHFILALSIQREDINGDIGFVCSIRCKISLPGMIPIQYKGAEQRTRHLVHLGKDNFCLVESCKLDEYSCYAYHQPIKLTTIKLNQENSECSMTVIDECVHLLQIPVCELFRVESCFYLPVCKTTPFKRGKNFCFNLDIFPAGFDPKQKLKTYSDSCYREPDEEFEDGPLVNVLSTSEPLAKSNATSNARALCEIYYMDAKGCCNYVRNLLPDAPFGHFEEQKKKFGLSIGFEIQFNIVDDNVSAMINEGHLAEMVEKRRIDLLVCRKVDEMSTIITEGFRAEMEEERRMPYALDTASAIITEGCRAEVSRITTEICQKEEERKIPYAVDAVSTIITEDCLVELEEKEMEEEDRRIPYALDTVSRITTEICQKEIEEERKIPYALDTVSTIITEDCRAKLEGKEKERRIPYSLDTVSGVIIEMERERRFRLYVDEVLPFITEICREETEVFKRTHALYMVSAIITKVCVEEMEKERRKDLHATMVRAIMDEICRAETEEEKIIHLIVDTVSAIIDGDFDALMEQNLRIWHSVDDKRTRRKLKKEFRDNMKKKVRDIALGRNEKNPPLRL